MNRRESQYFRRNEPPKQGFEGNAGKSPPVARPRHRNDGDSNTWLGDAEEFYDAYDREPYTREDCAKGQSRYGRYEDEYPQVDKGVSGFSLDPVSPRHGKDTRH